MSDAPEIVEYVLQPIESDQGEMTVEHEGDPLIVEVNVTDLADGLTLVVMPEDVPHEAVKRLAAAIEDRAKADGGHFILVQGDASKWRFARLVRKDKWDDDYGEPA